MPPLLLLVVLSPLLLVSVPLVHEGGHMLLAWLVGGRDIALVRKGRLSLVTRAELPDRALARRAFYAGGPLANLVVAAALVWASRGLSSAPTLLVLSLGGALVHLAFALVNLLPLEGHDGRALLYDE